MMNAQGVNYLQLPVESTGVAGVPQSCLQGVGDHVAHAGLRCLLLLGRLNLQQQGAAHGGGDQLRVHKQEHSGGKSGTEVLDGHPQKLAWTPQLCNAFDNKSSFPWLLPFKRKASDAKTPKWDHNQEKRGLRQAGGSGPFQRGSWSSLNRMVPCGGAG